MPRLSIVIPDLGNMEQVERGLASVLQHRPMDAEVLVVLTQPYDDPYELHEEVRFIKAPRGASLVEAANLGIHASKAAIVHLLAPGAEVAEDWTERPLLHFADPQVAAVAPLVLDMDDPSTILSAGVEYRTGGARACRFASRQRAAAVGACDVLGPTWQAGFYRKSAVESLGGFDVAIGDTLADVDLAISLQLAGLSAIFEPRSCVRAKRPGETESRSFHSGRAEERLFQRHAAAGHATSTARHVWMVLAEFGRGMFRPSAAAHLAGRIAAWIASGGRPRPLPLAAVTLQQPAASAQGLRIDDSHPTAHGRGALRGPLASVRE